MDEWVGQGPRDQLVLCDVVAGSSPKLLIVPRVGLTRSSTALREENTRR